MDENQLRHVESLCNALYAGTSSNERAAAQEQLLTLQSSADCIPQCQFILDHSTQPYAQLLASSSLESLLTQFWNNFDHDQTLEIRNYILNFLANNAHNLQDYVMGSIAKLACRITKLGWFDNIEHREIVDEVTKFLQGTIDHHLVGLRILYALVDEMNVPTTGRTLTTHRKTAVSFRDNSLFQVFQIALTTLRHIHTRSIPNMSPDQEKRMAQSALSLATACLSFDFIGTNPEESPEDVGTVQVPSTWRPIVQDTLTMQLFFDFYLNTEPPRSSQALEAIVQLSSVRRSLFAVEKERTVFLDHLMKNIHEIMLSKTGLEHAENYHEFCRLLGRLKASYQLSELVKTRGFSDWLGLAAEFTVTSLQDWQYSMNSIHYLLALWSRLVAALPYLRPDANDGQLYAQILRQCVSQVVEAYIDTMLGSVEVVVDGDGDVDDPLEDEGALREQMDKLPTLIRLQFEEIAQYLLNIFESAMGLYEQALSSGQNGPHIIRQVDILEGRLTWIVHMVAALVGSQSGGDTRKSAGNDQVWDGQLSRFIFQLVQGLEYRLGNSSGRDKCNAKLELALLGYFKSFKRAYLMDVGAIGSMNSPLGMGGVAPPAGKQPHPLLSLALSYGSEAKDASMEDTGGNVSVLGPVRIDQ